MVIVGSLVEHARRSGVGQDWVERDVKRVALMMTAVDARGIKCAWAGRGRH